MKRNIISLLFIFCVCFTNNVFSQTPQDSWSNPVLIQGSSFGAFFQELYKQGQYNEMLRFTSKKSIDTYGKDNLIKYYKNIDFGYKMKLKSKSVHDNITTLNYESDILGGKHITRLNVVVENDTCKLLLDNTMFHLGITWSLVNSSIR